MITKYDREKDITKRALALAIVLGGGAGVALSLQGLLSFTVPTQAVTLKGNNLKAEVLESVVNPFENISIEARAAVVVDLKTGAVLYAKNENEKLPLASITKLMTAFVARENFSESTALTVTKDSLSAEVDSGLNVGERWRMGDLLNVLLLVSSNDAARSIANFVGGSGQQTGEMPPLVARERFISMMNEKARELGLVSLEFFNESGLDVSVSQNGGYGSVKDVLGLFQKLWLKYPETIEITAHKDAQIFSQDKIAHYVPNTNEVVGHLSGLIASKTGFTELAGGNLAIIFDRGIGDPVGIVVLGSSYKGRFEDIQKLAAAAKELGAASE